MTKKVYMLRHAEQIPPTSSDFWDFGSWLVPGARSQVEAAARHFKELGVEFAAYRYSLLTRSIQTCTLLGEYMGATGQSLKLNEGLGPGEAEEWNDRYGIWLAEQDPENLPPIGTRELIELWPDLCEHEGMRVDQAIRQIAGELQDGQSALAVSHNPLIRLAEYAITDRMHPNLRYCQAVCFVFEDDWVSCEDISS
jgi:broad specificity phosphatase PhoE